MKDDENRPMYYCSSCRFNEMEDELRNVKRYWICEKTRVEVYSIDNKSGKHEMLHLRTSPCPYKM